MNDLNAPCVECGRFVTWKEAEETGQITRWNDGKSMGAKWICPTCLWKTKVLTKDGPSGFAQEGRLAQEVALLPKNYPDVLLEALEQEDTALVQAATSLDEAHAVIATHERRCGQLRAALLALGHTETEIDDAFLLAQKPRHLPKKGAK